MSFDKGRAIRILGDTAETYEEMLKDHPGSATSLEELLQNHAELSADRDAVTGLKSYLEVEYDCE